MNVYLYPSNVETELKNAYIGEYKGYSPTVNTIAYYPLKSDVKDYTNNGHDGTITGTTTYGTIGVFGYINFTGDNYVSATPMIPPEGPFTISCYLYYQNKIGAFVFQGSFGTQHAGITISIYPNPYLQVWSGGSGDWNSIYRLDLNTWYHVVLTYQNGTFTMYVNGNLVGTNNRTIATATPTDFHLGRYDNRQYGVGNVGGRLSEVIIEKGTRSIQKTQEYFNLTRDSYGL